MKIAIVTDSNSGITQEQAKTMGIYVLPMPFMINGETFEEDINLTQEEFYGRCGHQYFPAFPAGGYRSVGQLICTGLRADRPHPDVQRIERILSDCPYAGTG